MIVRRYPRLHGPELGCRSRLCPANAQRLLRNPCGRRFFGMKAPSTNSSATRHDGAMGRSGQPPGRSHPGPCAPPWTSEKALEQFNFDRAAPIESRPSRWASRHQYRLGGWPGYLGSSQYHELFGHRPIRSTWPRVCVRPPGRGEIIISEYTHFIVKDSFKSKARTDRSKPREKNSPLKPLPFSAKNQGTCMAGPGLSMKTSATLPDSRRNTNRQRETAIMKTDFRIVGMGYDIHRLVGGRPLVLGGVTIPVRQGPAGTFGCGCVDPRRLRRPARRRRIGRPGRPFFPTTIRPSRISTASNCSKRSSAGPPPKPDLP